MKKMKSAIMFMGIGALAATVGIKMMNSSNGSVNDLMNKEKRMFKQLKKKIGE